MSTAINTDEILPPANTIVAMQERAAYDSAIDIAKRHPRVVKDFQRELMAWATMDKDTASECFYAKPQGDSKLIGPSIRFAELISSAWGNVAIETRVVGEEDGHVIVEGTCRDLERNVTRRDQVRRPILTRVGKRYPQHLVEQTINAGASIAARNAILRVVPKALWNPSFKAALDLVSGKGANLSEEDAHADYVRRRDQVLDYLSDTLQVPVERVTSYLSGRQGGDITESDVLALQDKARRIRQRDTTIDREFPEARPETAETARDSRTAANNLVDSLGAEEPLEDEPGESEPGGDFDMTPTPPGATGREG